MFSNILGQNQVIARLKGTIKTGRIAHAYLFSGPVSVGKFTTAKGWAKALNCLNPADIGEGCAQCLACKKIEQNSHPDFITIIPNGTKIKIDQIRQLKKDMRYGPIEANWKVVVVDPAELMTTEAANSFLKLLEEPLPNVLFILNTINISGLLPTIRSRCQQIVFQPLTIEVAAKILKEKHGLPDELAKSIAKEAGGVLQDALLYNNQEVRQLIDKIENNNLKSIFACIETAKEMMAFKKDLASILNLLLNTAFRQKNKAGQDIILEAISALRYNVNKILLMETFLMKLGEIR